MYRQINTFGNYIYKATGMSWKPLSQMCKSNQTIINKFESSKKQRDELKCVQIFKKKIIWTS